MYIGKANIGDEQGNDRKHLTQDVVVVAKSDDEYFLFFQLR